MEGDAQHVITDMKKGITYWSLGGCLIQDACTIINSLSEWPIQHVHREANLVAHKLAKNSLVIDNDVYDMELTPNCISQDVILDISTNF